MKLANTRFSHKAVPKLALAGMLALGFGAQPAQAALTFQFNYISPGIGFDNPIDGADRKAALESAAAMLGAYFTNYTATVTYDVTSYESDNGYLASAGSGIMGDVAFNNTYVQEKIISNGATDLNGAAADGEINWNFFYDWGLTDNVPSGAYDFKSTAIHELLHSFGFLSYVSVDGSGAWGETPGTADSWTQYDYFLSDASGNYLIDENGIFDSNQVPTLQGGSSVFFDGPNANAANGGNRVPLFSPYPWEEGSSLSHVDDNSAVTSYMIMNAYAHNDGLDVRTISPIELGMLKDIGYTQVAAVPIPAAAWLMGSGLVALLGFGRRRKAG